MVGSIHPFGRYTSDIPHYPVHKLVWILWDRYRGRLDSPLVNHCCVCKNVTELVIDHLWKKWEHRSFIPFVVFFNNLINTDIYAYHMGKVSTEKMRILRFFCLGVSADPRDKTFIDETLQLRTRNF